ncbi:unnamed protein product [Polarella glacialis]|uniref:Uncharacterized protein n=1 Tax=Polarella glacialis TaxID=89957 RepID=A0A813DSE0_POLGL|nr:unnamed protein product [Polarella glacialis]
MAVPHLAIPKVSLPRHFWNWRRCSSATSIGRGLHREDFHGPRLCTAQLRPALDRGVLVTLRHPAAQLKSLIVHVDDVIVVSGVNVGSSDLRTRVCAAGLVAQPAHGSPAAAEGLTLQDSDAFEVAVAGWSGLTLAPLYADFAGLLTDAARLPLRAEDIPTLYATEGHAGLAVPPLLFAEHLGLSQLTAECFLEAMSTGTRTFLEAAREATTTPGEERSAAQLSDFVQSTDWVTAQKGDEVQLLAWVRQPERLLCGFGAGGLAAERGTRRLDAAPASHSRSGDEAQLHAQRGLGSTAARSLNGHELFSAAAPDEKCYVRELRDAVAASLPVVEGDVSELWGLLWLVPGLKRSLQLLDATHLPWPQKVWLLQHIRLLCERLLAFLEEDSSPFRFLLKRGEGEGEGGRNAWEVRVASCGGGR